jgi:hypothetical protein
LGTLPGVKGESMTLYPRWRRKITIPSIKLAFDMRFKRIVDAADRVIESNYHRSLQKSTAS